MGPDRATSAESSAVTYRPARFRALIGGCLAAFGVAFGAGFLLIGGLMALVILVLPGAPPELMSLGVGMPLLGLALIAASVWLGWQSGSSRRAHLIRLSPTTLTYHRPGGQVSLRLGEITRVSAREVRLESSDGFNTVYELVRVEGRTGDAVEIDGIPVVQYAPLFDPRPILRDLLPLLPADADVDPRVRRYAETGSTR